MQHFIDVDQARELILDEIKPLTLERLTLGEARGRILAEEIVATYDSPAFDNSARDGYAVRWEDVANKCDVSLDVVEHIAAGHLPVQSVGPGGASRIMTGAPMPDGADTIVMREDCQEHGDRVVIVSPPQHQGQWVRKQGSFIRHGQPLMTAGQRLESGDLAILASFAQAQVTVGAKPRVAILSTGDELVELGQPHQPGQIINSNTPMLASLVEAHGGIAQCFPIVRDTPEAVMAAYQDALRLCDLVISSGGASVGDHDHVVDVVNALTDTVAFWKIRMKPGKPLIFGMAGDTPLIGLPGNPVSSFVCFYQFVRPALAALQGAKATALRSAVAQISCDVRSTPKRREYLTGQLKTMDGQLTFVPHAQQDSGNLGLLCQTDALGIVEEGISQMAQGDAIVVQWL